MISGEPKTIQEAESKIADCERVGRDKQKSRSIMPARWARSGDDLRRSHDALRLLEWGLDQ